MFNTSKKTLFKLPRTKKLSKAHEVQGEQAALAKYNTKRTTRRMQGLVSSPGMGGERTLLSRDVCPQPTHSKHSALKEVLLDTKLLHSYCK